MGKIKRLFSIGFALLFIFCMSVSFMGCTSYYCDPKGKEWYNVPSLPNIDQPYNAVYDGSYSIKIDKNGRVVFKTLGGEVLEGQLTSKLNTKTFSMANLSIKFDGGKTATGWCDKNKDGRTLKIRYEHNLFVFTDKKQYTKEEFDAYRKQFVDFLVNVYETGNFPTQEEIEGNSLYKQFTNYHQIDPCCGGPITYATAQRATIEKIELVDKYTIPEYTKMLTLNINGQTLVCELLEDAVISNIKDGEIVELTSSDLTTGDCLVGLRSYWDGNMGEYEYRISKVFYVEK